MSRPKSPVVLRAESLFNINMTAFLGFEDPISSITHLAAAVGVVIGTFYLLKRGRGNPARIAALLIYSFSLVFLFSMSGVYHLLTRDTLAREVLQRLDYAGIWVLIAGSFTPIHVILFRGAWRWGILLLVWTIAITGLVLQVVFFADFPHWLSVILFLGLGWMGTLTGYKFRKSFTGHSLKLLAWGGIYYSIGAIIDAVNWPVIWDSVLGPHEIFHVFVILGALSHWRFIYEWCDHPVINTLLFHVTIVGNRYSAYAHGDFILIESDDLDELKREIKKQVDRKFRERIRPVVRLRYYQEEHLHDPSDESV